MTRIEYFMSKFPNADKSIRYIHSLCCRELGLTTKCDINVNGCFECWHEEYIPPLPKCYTQPLLDKFNKLW